MRSTPSIGEDRDAFLGHCDPAAEWHVTGLVVDQQRVYRQAEAIWQYLCSFADEFTEFQADFGDFIDAGEKVVVVVRLTGRGRASGATVDLRYAVLVTVRNGKMLRSQNYAETEQALEAAGLRD